MRQHTPRPAVPPSPAAVRAELRAALLACIPRGAGDSAVQQLVRKVRCGAAEPDRMLAAILYAAATDPRADLGALLNLPRTIERVIRALVSEPGPVSGGALREAAVVEMSQWLLAREQRAQRPSCRSAAATVAKEAHEASAAILAEALDAQRAAMEAA